jgi:hypothetical protein
MDSMQSGLLVAGIAALWLASGPAADGATMPCADSQTVAAQPAEPLPTFGAARFDSVLTDQARIYAGLRPLDSMRFRNLTLSKGWATHRELFTENWSKLEKRFEAMERWRETELAGIPMAGATLFYPFSGPDFLNADVFFPECDTQVYISLEKAGTIPAADVSEERFVNFIEDIRASLSNIFVRNYFVTKRMQDQFHTTYLQGNLAVFMVFLARRHCALVSVTNVCIDSQGVIAGRPAGANVSRKKTTAGIDIQYVKAGTDGKIRHLYYFAVDIQDSSLALKPQVQSYLRSQNNMVMFTKAASYCLHGDNFSIIRDLCLRARMVLEDDSGIPYRFFKPEEWTVTLYGNYTRQSKYFNYGFQKDMAEVFKSGKGIKPLSFNVGYHWEDQYSSLILAVRK